MVTEKVKVALVTGGAAGIGKAISTRLAKDGIQVGILDFNIERAEALSAELNAQGCDTIALQADVTKKADVDAAFDKLIAKYGRIDALCNNAGLGGNLPIFDVDVKDWDRMMMVNVDAIFICGQRAAKEFVKQGGGGKIIITLSQAAFTQDHDAIAYCTSKWAARGLMRNMATALAPYDITVNGICPGVVWTEMIDGFCKEFCEATGQTRADYEKLLSSMIPLKRIQTAEDIAAMYAFLIREGHHISGQSLNVSGGMAFS